jgi:hypothetical protein
MNKVVEMVIDRAGHVIVRDGLVVHDAVEGRLGYVIEPPTTEGRHRSEDCFSRFLCFSGYHRSHTDAEDR